MRKWAVNKGGKSFKGARRQRHIRRSGQRGGSLASFLGLNKVGNSAVNVGFDRLDALTPRLIEQLGREARITGQDLTRNAISQLIDIPANRVKGAINRNITTPILRLKDKAKLNYQSGVNKVKAIKRILTGKGIHKRRRKRTRRRQRGKGLPLMLAKMLGPLVMGGVADFAFKKLRSKL